MKKYIVLPIITTIVLALSGCMRIRGTNETSSNKSMISDESLTAAKKTDKKAAVLRQ
ncbi:hypothetical protein [Clostridium thermarum]|uniref:hypothetical protein n=1 Tax=Clostridium thermarum TaxID=1716543 RepID=UPI0013D57433|nr:hypothetical protein [Clostridium thermarum]